MKRKNATRSALFTSVISMLLCISMLVGTTFAWFTDSVTSANNIIKSGNLDIELEYWTGTEWADVEGKSDILTNELWEPGVTEIAYLRVANAGSLALKYQLGINIVSETLGKTKDNKDIKLSDHIQFGVVEGVNGETGAYANREAAVAALTNAQPLSSGYAKPGTMAPEGELYLALVVYMPTTVGNEANHNGVNAPEINLGISVFATQQMSENDSFGPDYDKGAAWTGLVDIDWYLDAPDATEYVLTSAEELAGLAAIVNGTAVAPVTTYAATNAPATIQDTFAGKTIKLGADIDLRDVEWTPIGRIGKSSTDFTYAFKGTFDGQKHTVANLNVSNTGWAGLFGIAHSATINNVTVSGAKIFSNRMAGAIVGQLYGSIGNCHVKDATIIVVPNAVGDSYDNGDKVGGIVGWLGDNGNNRTLTNCSAEKVKVGAYRDVGGIAGYVASSTTVKDNSVKDVKVTVDQTTNYYGDKEFNAGKIYGRTGGAITEENNTTTDDCTIDITYAKNGLTLKRDGVSNEVVLYLVPETYEGATVNVPEGVTAIGNYAFAYNSNVKEVILPTSVKDLGRGFDESTVEKVVLNEGLETISSRAFRSTTALKEVVISSTVKEIADNAFQKSGIKEIVIPASVETIGETAFGASLIEKVTFEGNTSIQGYAFRGCPNLRTVYLYGDEVTFIASTLNGRNSMWFCNGESNNPNTSNITFYVVNETVKERVLTAMGAERNNTKIIILSFVGPGGLYKDADGAYFVTNAEGLEALNKMMADKTAGTGVVVNLIADIDFSGKTWTPVDSHVDTTFYMSEINGNGHTISNLTVNGQAMFKRFAGSGDVVIKDITFDNANINSNGSINTSILTVQTYQNVLLDNVDVKNSTITGGYKVAPLIATVYNESSSTITATLKNCDVNNVVVTATSYDFCTTGMVAFVYADDNDKIEFENCTVSNVKLYAPNAYTAHAAIYTTGSETLFNEAEGVTVTNVTFKNK